MHVHCTLFLLQQFIQIIFPDQQTYVHYMLYDIQNKFKNPGLTHIQKAVCWSEQMNIFCYFVGGGGILLGRIFMERKFAF